MTGFTAYDIRIYAFVGGVLNSVRIDDKLDLSPGYEYEERIEEPGLSNRFSAPQLTFQGYDTATLDVITLLRNISPTNFVGVSEYEVHIIRSTSPIPLRWAIIPESVRVNLQQRSWSFTCVGEYAWASKVDASSLFRRSTTGWTVATAQTLQNTLTITKFVNDCDILPGDTVLIGAGGGFPGIEAEVVSVQPDTTTSFRWILTFKDLTFQFWQAGVPINVADAPQVNVLLQDVVDALLTQASLPPTFGTSFGFQVQLLSQPGNPFRSAIAPGAAVPKTKLGLAPNFGPTTGDIIAGTSTGSYINTNPPFDNWFLQKPSATKPPVDPTNWPTFTPFASQADFYGDKLVEIGPILPTGEFDHTAFAYAKLGPVGSLDRVSLTTIWVPGSPNSWIQFIKTDRSFDGVNWVNIASPYSASGTTTTDLRPFLSQWYQGLAAPVNPFPGPNPLPGTLGTATAQAVSIAIVEGNAIFTQVFNMGGVGSSTDFQLAWIPMYSAGSATTITTPLRGALITCQVQFGTGASLYVFSLDQINGQVSVMRRYDVSTIFGFSASLAYGPVAWSALFRPETLKRNYGMNSNTFNALSYSDGVGGIGLLFHTFSDPNLSTGLTPIQLATPVVAASPASAALFSNTVGQGLDLAVIPDITIPQSSGTLWPCAVLSPFGGMIWVSQKWSGLLDEVDLKGMSVGDALSQLAVLVNALWYPIADVSPKTAFRTRNLATGLTSIGALDDAESVGGAIELSVSKTVMYQYVRVTNDNDNSIIGEAGDPSYNGTENGLELSNRFVLSESLADAVASYLYNYWRVKRTSISIPHFDDWRGFDLGKTFTAPTQTTDTLQIVGIGRSLFSSMLKIEGTAV